MRAHKYNGLTECDACDLRAGCTQVVPASGNIFARLAFVGEAPGEDEDREGVPFIGKAGKAIDSLLQFLDVERRDVYITNTVKCRPVDDKGRNDKPDGEQIKACSPWLRAELALVQPRIIVALGGYALQATTKMGRSITKPATKFSKHSKNVLKPRYPEWGAAIVCPFFHPAALFYPGSKDKIEVWKAACKKLRKLCASVMLTEAEDTERDPSLDV